VVCRYGLAFSWLVIDRAVVAWGSYVPLHEESAQRWWYGKILRKNTL
jgi:hypothetical protein